MSESVIDCEDAISSLERMHRREKGCNSGRKANAVMKRGRFLGSDGDLKFP